MKQYSFPSGYTFLQSISRTLKLSRDPVSTMQESMQRFGGTYTVHLGITRYINTQDPGFIEHILKSNHRNYQKSPIQTERLGKFLGNGLLTSNGEFWLRQRRLIQPGFHADKILSLYGFIEDTCVEFMRNVKEGKQDIYPLMNQLAFDIVLNSLFNIKLHQSVKSELSQFIIDSQHFIVNSIRKPYKRWWYKISGEERRHLKRAENSRSIIRNLIQERLASEHKFNDLLDMLLEARYEDTGKPMEENQLIDEILVLIIAGHETTANALSWTLHLLANHQQEQIALRNHLKNLTRSQCVMDDRLQSVIKESMRLFPPAWASDRIALNDDQYGSFSFPRGTIIIMFYYGLHRNGKYWECPEEFRPARFQKENFDKDKLKMFYPFGAGPRQCIGSNFALAEMAIFLWKFLQHFSVVNEGTLPKLNPLITLKPDQVIVDIKKIGY